MSEQENRPKRRRCHHCNNQECEHVSIRQIKEDCPDYIMLDPALRPRRFDNFSGKRIRIKKKVCLSIRNLNFIEDVVLDLDKKMFVGRKTRGVNHCIKSVCDALGGSIPEIPTIEEDDRGDMTGFDTTNTPENHEFLMGIVEHYKGGNNTVSYSRAVDYCISMLRKTWEAQQK